MAMYNTGDTQRIDFVDLRANDVAQLINQMGERGQAEPDDEHNVFWHTPGSDIADLLVQLDNSQADAEKYGEVIFVVRIRP